jgi:hypothetical protein
MRPGPSATKDEHHMTRHRDDRRSARRRIGRLALLAACAYGAAPAGGGADTTAHWGNPRPELAFALATDGDGTVYAGSQFSGTLDDARLGGDGTLQAPDRSTGLIVAFDAAGKPKWRRTLTGAGPVELRALGADAAGVVAAGHFLDALDAADGARPSQGGADLFVAAYGMHGAPRWTRTLGGKYADTASAVALLADGSAVVGAEFQLTARFGAVGGAPRVLSARGDRDVVLLELDGSGAIRQAWPLGGPGREQLMGLAALDGGAYLALVGYEQSIEVDTATGPRRFDARGHGDALLVRCEAGRGVTDAVSLGVDGPEAWYAFAAHRDGRAWLATTLTRRATFALGDARRELAPRGSDVLLLQVGPDLQLERAALLGGDGTESAERLATLPDGGALLGATFDGPLRAAGRAFEPDGTDVLVVRYDARGKARGAETVGGPRVQQVTGLAPLPDRRYALLGLFEDTLHVAGEKRARAKAAGKTDAFVLMRPWP